jgi:phosphate acetyl/butyryl transferase
VDREEAVRKGVRRHGIGDGRPAGIGVERVTRRRRVRLDGDGRGQVIVGFSAFERRPNVLIVPNLAAGNIAYKLLRKFSSGHLIGPIMIGMDRPVHVLDRGASLQALVNLAAISTVHTVAARAGGGLAR